MSERAVRHGGSDRSSTLTQAEGQCTTELDQVVARHRGRLELHRDPRTLRASQRVGKHHKIRGLVRGHDERGREVLSEGERANEQRGDLDQVLCFTS